ncbi:macro domain-containing protein [Actinoplanes sp. NPDC051513]|uniref:macro domain-containing protein n=1 Tax=Actinoplanes sp. NPDC051513 TaxID=3363908 RepID=UPI0037969DF4
MTSGATVPDPAGLHTLQDLAEAFTRLRRRAARKGQVQLSVRDIAARVQRPASTLDPYLRGVRLCPADAYEDILRVLGVRPDQLRPWLDAWERIAEDAATRSAAAASPARSTVLPYNETFEYRISGAATGIGLVTGDIRRVTWVDVWVNSENTEMRMSRYEENSISAIIRFEGALRDTAGHVIRDDIANELERAVAGRRPVPAGTTVVTGPGVLAARNGVRYVVHVAAVRGEPGEGYRPVADLGRCVTNALVAAEELSGVASILFPLLGAGVAGGAAAATARTMVGAALDHVTGRRHSRLTMIYLLASTAEERDACLRVMTAIPRLSPGDG